MVIYEKSFLQLLATSAILCYTTAVVAPAKPNIVWFLTDDQDQVLGGSFPELNGVGPMPQTKAILSAGGSTATNFFIHTPICCPSRSELLSGRYFHNIKSTDGSGCMHVNETKVNPYTFARYLEEGGYTVGMFGKYLNTVPADVPPGFDVWMANGGGDYVSPRFATKNINFMVPASKNIPDGHNSDMSAVGNYSTSVIGNVSRAWIRSVVTKKRPEEGNMSSPGNVPFTHQPFFAYIAPKAAHEPFNPAPWYVDHWDDSWPAHEPRPVNWNCSAASRQHHHGAIATAPMLDESGAKVITGVFKNRWRTLMSVDDVIGAIYQECVDLGVADNTYFFYSSDHGFQLGEFNILMDKRQPYDWDTRIHLLARGPGIKPGSTWSQPATQVDMAPTFLGLAGIQKPVQMDGKSLVPLLMDAETIIAPSLHQEEPMDAVVSASTKAHLVSLGGNSTTYGAGWRTAAFIEYYFNDPNAKCVGDCLYVPRNLSLGYPTRDSWCTDLTANANTKCWAIDCSTECYPTESTQNNYIGLRSMSGSRFGDTLYAEFQKSGGKHTGVPDFSHVDYHEYFDAAQDKWMMNNIYSTLSTDQQVTVYFTSS